MLVISGKKGMNNPLFQLKEMFPSLVQHNVPSQAVRDFSDYVNILQQYIWKHVI